MSGAADLREQALAAEKAGDLARAHSLLAQAVKAAPDDARLLNSAGVSHLRWNEPERAAALFARARRCDPEQLDYALNEAIALGRLGRHREAARLLASVEQLGKGETRYWSARGNAERLSHELAAAQRSYDEVLQRDPRHARGLHGRARVALERGQADALDRIERAMAVRSDDADLWLAKALALDALGRTGEALTIARGIVSQAPRWVEGLNLLAQLRLGAGDPDFADHYADAARTVSSPDAVYVAWAKTLGGLDQFAEAADVAAEARGKARQAQIFALFEAVYAGMDGQKERAEQIFGGDTGDTFDGREQRARHDIRMGRVEKANAALADLLERQPEAVGVWALQDVCWRLLGDERHEWLHGRDGLVRSMEFPDREILSEARDFLKEQHRHAALPLGQSVRGGTQTRGRLFQRGEPVLAQLQAAIMATIEEYRAQLPPAETDHPILRHRDAPWRLTHSWSVRLVGAGYHTSHIHPLGVLSSALYLTVPDAVEDENASGHLEIGRPPPDLETGLEPLRTIKPEPGLLALFPSTLYHGTREFEDGERMTVAFDVSAGDRT